MANFRTLDLAVKFYDQIQELELKGNCSVPTCST